MAWLVLFIIGSITIGPIVATSNPIVRIKNGTLEGIFMKSRKGREIAAFMGIPYALPPLGELRFEPPKPAESWTKVLSAKNNSKLCTQRDIFMHQEDVVGEEDCLYLNVYTPQLEISKGEFKNHKTYPVMIWFHGGGWVTGTGNFDFFKPKFLLDHEVILVTVNYRLGPLGFLSTEDSIILGNQGLKDQSQSIRWVHENIAEFGGDPNRVTLFGESAGGISTHYHMISPLSRGLFQRAISQSGTALCLCGVREPGKARSQAKKLGKILKCPTSNSKELLDCLKKKSNIDIIATDRAFQVFDYCPLVPFRPVVEPDHPGAFFKEDPAESLRTGRLADIPWMTGMTSHEGSIKAAAIYGKFNGELLRRLNEDFDTIAPITLLYESKCPENLIKNMTKRIREFYFGDGPIDESRRFDLINMYTDAWFFMATDSSVRSHLKALSSPVYYYHFAYRGSASFSQIFGDETRDYGVTHIDELLYLFPLNEELFPNTPMSEDDKKTIDLMTSIWFNFANSGNPTPEISSKVPIKWKPVRTQNIEYLHIKKYNEIFMDRDLWPERLQFWKSLPCFEDVSIQFGNRGLKDEL